MFAWGKKRGWGGGEWTDCVELEEGGMEWIDCVG